MTKPKEQTIKKCKHCNRYTLSRSCAVCGEKTQEIRPPRYSPEDKYGVYRRQNKLSMRSGD